MCDRTIRHDHDVPADNRIGRDNDAVEKHRARADNAGCPDAGTGCDKCGETVVHDS